MIDIEIAIENLKKLSEEYKEIEFKSSKGFYTNVCNSLMLPENFGISRYDNFEIRYADGYGNDLSIRGSNHHANAANYVIKGNDCDYCLSVMIARRIKPNTFVRNSNVRLDEFVYFDSKLIKVDSPLSKICDGLISFLKTGVYKDFTGVAITNASPK